MGSSRWVHPSRVTQVGQSKWIGSGGFTQVGSLMGVIQVGQSRWSRPGEVAQVGFSVWPSQLGRVPCPGQAPGTDSEREEGGRKGRSSLSMLSAPVPS